MGSEQQLQAVEAEIEAMAQKDNLSETVAEVQRLVAMLVETRDRVAQDPLNAQQHLARLPQQTEQHLKQAKRKLRPIYNRLGSYSKALDALYIASSRHRPLTAELDALALDPALLNRSIMVHLLRQGHFGVAERFLDDLRTHPPRTAHIAEAPTPPPADEWRATFDSVSFDWPWLFDRFRDLHRILAAMNDHMDLQPAIAWTRQNSAALDARGSDLAYNIVQAQFILIFTGRVEPAGSVGHPSMRAWAFARSEFPALHPRYEPKTRHLLGSLAYAPNLASSPYASDYRFHPMWDDMPRQFRHEFCSLLGLSADSALYTAVTAGTLALPAIMAVQEMLSKKSRTAWTSRTDLPVEVGLPHAYHFHPIFVCPVSKEQTTKQNPPMMLPCGHVLARQTVSHMAKNNARFKCPYCPVECNTKQAKQLFL